MQHSTTFHCPEDFCFDYNTRADTSARSHAPNNVQRKRTQKREAPASRFSGYQGEASFATSWVHKLDHKDSWPPHPLQAASLIVHLRLPSRSPLRGALSLFLSREALTSLSFHLTLTHGPLLSSPEFNQPGVDPSSSTRTGVVPYTQRLYAVSRRSHISIT